MRKIFIICFLVFIYVVEINAQTPVIGFISENTTWTKANSPYFTLGNVLVNEGITLTIEPGVTIEFDTGHKLIIDGTLIAQGTAEDTIRFTPKETMEPGSWGGILFEDSSIDGVYDEYYNYLNGSIIQYCLLEYANIGIKGESGFPFVDNCNICNSSESGILVMNNNTIILNSEIINTSEIGIQITDGDSIIINDNYISKNGKSGIFINCGDNIFIGKNEITNNNRIGIEMEGENIFIKENIIKNNTLYGIYSLNDSELLNISDNHVSENENGGMYIRSKYAEISNNSIVNNKIESYGSQTAGYGCGIKIMCDSAYISNNSICMNEIIVTGSAMGGGINIVNGNVVIKDNIINYNKAKSSYHQNSRGGGISIRGGSAKLIDNEILGNEAYYYGGGIYVYDVDELILEGNSLINNKVDRYGGGGYIKCDTASIVTNKFEKNEAKYGGGIFVENWTNVNIADNIITENVAYDGAGILVNKHGNKRIYENKIYNNQTNESGNSNALYIRGNPIFHMNAIFNNQTKYEIYFDQPNGSPNLDATNNYWGVTTEGEIRARIYDYFQDDQLAIVDVVPFLTENPFGEEPNIWLSSSSHDYGTMPVGEYNDWTLILYNFGDTTLTVNSINSNDAAFSICSPNFPQNISPVDSLNVIVSGMCQVVLDIF